MTKETTKDIVVIYHGQCRDGFTAAWAAWKKFGSRADYVPVVWTNLSEQIPEMKDKEIYFLDYVPVQEKLDSIARRNTSVQIIDHHKSRQAEAESLKNSVFDLKHSAAVLSWKFFHPGTPVPQLCLYVEDSDIWKWEIPNAAEVLDAVDLKREFDFAVWDSIAADLEDPITRKQYEEQGAIIARYRRKVTETIIQEHAQLVSFEGHEIYAINAPRYFKSELGNMLATRKPPFAVVWSQTPVEISVSLRSVGGFDLIPIAAKYGGGGHPAASNFRLPLDAPLPWKLIKNDER